MQDTTFGLDPRLLQEALRRAQKQPLNTEADAAAVLAAIVEAARTGTRDMHGLVRAGTRKRVA